MWGRLWCRWRPPFPLPPARKADEQAEPDAEATDEEPEQELELWPAASGPVAGGRSAGCAWLPALCWWETETSRGWERSDCCWL